MKLSENIVLNRDKETKMSKRHSINQQKIDWSQELQINESNSAFLRIRKTIFNILENPAFNLPAKVYSIVFSILIVASVLQFSLETVYALNQTEYQNLIFQNLDLAFNILFSIDYFSKILFCPNYRKLPQLLLKPSWIIDFLSILPFYIILLSNGSTDANSLKIIRIVRIFRILRLLKASKNVDSIQIVFKALIKSRGAIVMLFFMISNILLLFSSFIYYSEKSIMIRDPNSQMLIYTDGPLKGTISQFQSIPHTMWFCIVTLTTVGYGDMYI